jgi:hypothetical protein
MPAPDRVRVTREVDGRALIAICAAGQEPLARDLLESWARLAARSPLTAGVRLRFGWSTLTLRDDAAGGLLICEPDFDGRAEADVRPSVAATLAIVLQQVTLARRVGAVPADTAFDDDVIVRRGALDGTQVDLYREEPEPGDSGWRVLRLDAPSTNPSDFEALPAHRLLQLRPALVPVLALPSGYGVRLIVDRIAHVFDTAGRDVAPAD